MASGLENVAGTDCSDFEEISGFVATLAVTFGVTFVVDLGVIFFCKPSPTFGGIYLVNFFASFAGFGTFDVTWSSFGRDESALF